MTTLAILKATISDDLARSDSNITTVIGNEITRAIEHYQSRRFWFNESRSSTFLTVADQMIYSPDDDADIANFIEIDQAFINDGSTDFKLNIVKWSEVESAVKNSTSGRPTEIAMLNGTLGFYQIPDAAYTVRVIGHEKIAVPATDSEADNPWMVYAFDLIRSRAEMKIEARYLKDRDAAMVSRELMNDALHVLDRESASKMGTGHLVPTQF